MCNNYSDLIKEANTLMKTFTISYNVIGHNQELFSSTYDELSSWVRKALKHIEQSEADGKECSLYKTIRRFRGRAGDITLEDFKILIHDLETANA